MLNLIVNSEKLNELNKQMNSILQEVPEQMRRLSNELSVCDKEASDILHLIELSNFHASDGYKLSKDLQITRRRRREIKDEIETLNKFNDTIGKHRPLGQQIKAVHSLFGQEKFRKKNRVYTPRVRRDFDDKFKSISEQQKEV